MRSLYERARLGPGEANEASGADEAGDDGFTLIELMLVVLIIAILLATVIPTFLGARTSANARAAQSNLSTALSAEQAYYTATQSFSGVITDLTSVEPSLAWTTSPPIAKGGSTVSAIPYTSAGAEDTGDNNDPAVILQAYGKDGNCWAVLQIDTSTNGLTPGTYYSATSAVCAAPSAFPASTALVSSGKASSHIGSGNWYPSF